MQAYVELGEAISLLDAVTDGSVTEMPYDGDSIAGGLEAKQPGMQFIKKSFKFVWDMIVKAVTAVVNGLKKLMEWLTGGKKSNNKGTVSATYEKTDTPVGGVIGKAMAAQDKAATKIRGHAAQINKAISDGVDWARAALPEGMYAPTSTVDLDFEIKLTGDVRKKFSDLIKKIEDNGIVSPDGRLDSKATAATYKMLNSYMALYAKTGGKAMLTAAKHVVLDIKGKFNLAGFVDIVHTRKKNALGALGIKDDPRALKDGEWVTGMLMGGGKSIAMLKKGTSLKMTLIAGQAQSLTTLVVENGELNADVVKETHAAIAAVVNATEKAHATLTKGVTVSRRLVEGALSKEEDHETEATARARVFSAYLSEETASLGILSKTVKSLTATIAYDTELKRKILLAGIM